MPLGPLTLGTRFSDGSRGTIEVGPHQTGLLSPPYIGDGLARAPFYWACGLECNNLGHFGSNIQGSPTIVSSGQRTGAKALAISAGAAQEYALVPFLDTTIRKTVASYYVYFNSLAGTIHETIMVRTAASNSARIYYDPVGTKLTASFSAGTTSSSGAITTGRWYLIDILVDTTTGTSTLDWYLDGVYVGQASNVQAAHDQLGVRFGSFVSVAVDFIEDDLVLSQRAADFPIGPHTVDLYQAYETVTRITAQTITPGVTGLTLTPFAPSVLAPALVVPGVKALTLTRFAPAVLTPVLAVPGVKALTLTPLVPTVSVSGALVVTPGVKALALTPFVPSVLAPRLAVPGLRALTLTPFAPTVLAPRLAVPGLKALTLTRFTPTVLTPRLVVPGVKALTLSAFAPSVLAPRLVVPGVKALAVTRFAPTVTATNAQTVVPGTKALAITRFTPTVLAPRLVVPGLRALGLTRFAPLVTVAPLVAGGFGTVGAVWVLRDQAGALVVGAQASAGATSIARDSVGVTFVLRDSAGATASARDSVGASLG